jgi:hypothetical protein
MTKVFNPQWNDHMDVDDKLFQTMADHNFQPTHTGGGCMAWERADSRGSTLITDGDAGLGEWKERNEKIWVVSRYNEDGIGEVTLLEPLILVDAFIASNLLPSAPENDQTTIDTFAELKDPVPAVTRLSCREALETVIEAVERTYCVEGLPADLEDAVKTLVRILEQKGCEHFDSSVTDGTLTTLMDVVIFG